jgi:hypothetical protein
LISFVTKSFLLQDFDRNTEHWVALTSHRIKAFSSLILYIYVIFLVAKRRERAGWSKKDDSKSVGLFHNIPFTPHTDSSQAKDWPINPNRYVNGTV